MYNGDIVGETSLAPTDLESDQHRPFSHDLLAFTSVSSVYSVVKEKFDAIALGPGANHRRAIEMSFK